MEKYVCIHGHFYQPPRENAWLEDVELQDSAYPFHDWNERITAECYAPNTAARLLDSKGWIKKIVNNYASLSFNFGPTLLDWLEDKEPDVYRAIIAADRESEKYFSGHGSALAQAYNHMIMPLANRRDKYTQVIWGLRDFALRFGRQPEGMWLPETAVDVETLDIMAEHGIKFTILAPHQAQKVRKIGASTWEKVGDRGIDPSMAYQTRLPSGRTINLFFYDGPISQAVAFEGLLTNGEKFARRLLTGFSNDRTWPQLVHIATDGETYGHHHPYGEMALAYALDYLQTKKLARVTNYGEYLALHPPTHEVEVRENTSWSCIHGVERWRNNCGCRAGRNPQWNQAWRAPLRAAMNWLRNTLAAQFEEQARQFLKEPWAARDDYISVILDRSAANGQEFLAKHATRPLEPAEQVTVLKLLEMQRHALLMYTSCGWFFDEISGLETVQVIQYAGRAIQLAVELGGNSPENRFLELLAQAKSNLPEQQDGAHIYQKFVKPAIIDLPKVSAHYAISSLFEDYEDRTRIFCYLVDRQEHHTTTAGQASLAVGRGQVTSMITREAVTFSYGVVHLGNHNLTGCIQVYRDEAAYQEMVRQLVEAFARADLAEASHVVNKCADGLTYSLKELFRDQQRKVIDVIIAQTLAEVTSDYRRVYERHAPLMRFLQYLHIPQPQALYTAAQFVLIMDLRQAFAKVPPDFEQIAALLEEVKQYQISLEEPVLRHTLEQTLEQIAGQLDADPGALGRLGELDQAVALARSLPFEVNLWKPQNVYYKLVHSVYPDYRRRADGGEEEARTWLERFITLGDRLQVRREN